ncbi:Copia protein, partial [Mucuna pruriens]
MENCNEGGDVYDTEKQDMRASTIQCRGSEFIAATGAINQKNKTEIFVDNQATISIANNSIRHGKTKHFNIKLYFLREMQQSGEFGNQLVDMFTKSLSISKFELLRQKLEFAFSKARRSLL